MLDDHKDGQATKIKNTENMGNIMVSGNHELENIKQGDGGQIAALERKFEDKPKLMLMDLATFKNLVNSPGSNLSLKGEN